jgi:nucleotide-binding universal stress UspA family protein
MQTAWKLLAPIDLARHAQACVQHAIDVASSMRADLTLLYVVDPLRSRSGRPIEWPGTRWLNTRGATFAAPFSPGLSLE